MPIVSPGPQGLFCKGAEHHEAPLIVLERQVFALLENAITNISSEIFVRIIEMCLPDDVIFPYNL